MDKIYVIEWGSTWKYATKEVHGHHKTLEGAKEGLAQCLIDMDEYKLDEGEMPWEGILVMYDNGDDFYRISEVKLDD